MRLHERVRLNEALKKLHPKSSSKNVYKFYQYPASSPTSTDLNFGNYELEEDSSSPRSSSKIPTDIPEGYFAVYVGDESKRYVIPLDYLNHKAFRALLSRAEEEFGYSSSGAIRLPCDTVYFDRLLRLLNGQETFCTPERPGYGGNPSILSMI